MLEAKTGKELFKQNSSFNSFFDPVEHQNKIYYQTEDSQLKEFNIKSKTAKTVFNFQSNQLGCSQIFKIDDSLYIQDCDYNVIKLDLKSYKKELVDKGNKGLLGRL